MTKDYKKSLTAATVGFILISGAAQAQTAPSTSSNRVFEPAYFTQYAPRNALNMLGRIPGFQLDGGDNKRGLGQGGANVLINGQRLTGKSNDPFEQVALIASKNVVKIEILDGNSLNIPGLSGQVANIITKASGLTGTWEWSPEWRNRLKPSLLNGFVTVSGESGNLTYKAKFNSNIQRNGHWGPEERRDAAGELFEIRDEVGRYDSESPGAAVNLTWTPTDDKTGNLNLEYNLYNRNNSIRSALTSYGPRGFNGQHFYSDAEDEWNAKIDGDYEQPLGSGKIKFTGYYRAEHSPTVSRFDVYDTAALIESTRFYEVADEGEAIARTEYSWSNTAGHDWQIAAEGAFNFLDIEYQFIDLLDPNNSSDIDGSRVEEKRGEATITHTRSLSPKWDTQLSLGAEFSQLSQGVLNREFVRPKGFISATYKPSDDFTIRSKLEREVGQLNFFDFISSVSLQDDFDRAGNPDLVPSQSWIGTLEFDRQFKDGHSLKAKFFGEKISDLVDRIPIGQDGDGVGNIDSASQYGVEFDATIKGDPWGLKGMELNLELDLRDSSVIDPVEGFSRRLNGEYKSYWSASFRHDIPNSNWAYGFFADQGKEALSYHLNTVNGFNFDGPWGQVFVEHKDIMGLKVNASLRNLFDASDDFRRVIYTDRRDVGTIDVIEDRTRPFGMFFRLTVSGTF